MSDQLCFRRRSLGGAFAAGPRAATHMSFVAGFALLLHSPSIVLVITFVLWRQHLLSSPWEPDASIASKTTGSEAAVASRSHTRRTTPSSRRTTLYPTDVSDRCRLHDCTKGCAHTQTRNLGDDEQLRPNKNSFLIMHYKP